MKRIFCIVVIFLLTGNTEGQEIKRAKATDLEKLITESKTPLIVNMWATWCKPCIEEIPYFLEEVKNHNDKLRGQSDSILLLLVSLDFKEAFPEAISRFVEKRKFTAPVAWLDETNADYFCPKIDAKWSGAIPATLFINNKTGYRKFIEEQISHENLKKELKAVVEKK